MIRGSWAVRIWPNCGLFRIVVTRGIPGAPARKLLVRLNASARTSTVLRSVTRKMRDSAISISQNPGPGMLERPELPSVPRADCANAAGLIQHDGLGSSHSGLVRIGLGR